MKVIIVYGSTTGNTERAAELIGENVTHDATVVNVNDVNLDDIKAADLVLFGASTWDYGIVQDDFEAFLDKFDADLLAGKNVAVFGCGDAIGYEDTFCDAVDIIAEKAEMSGATIVAEGLKIDGESDDNLEEIITWAVQF